MPLDEFANMGEGKFGILGLGRKFRPRICAIVEHDATEHTVVVEDECRLFGADNKVVVLLVFVIRKPKISITNLGALSHPASALPNSLCLCETDAH